MAVVSMRREVEMRGGRGGPPGAEGRSLPALSAKTAAAPGMPGMLHCRTGIAKSTKPTSQHPCTNQIKTKPTCGVSSGANGAPSTAGGVSEAQTQLGSWHSLGSHEYHDGPTAAAGRGGGKQSGS